MNKVQSFQTVSFPAIYTGGLKAPGYYCSTFPVVSEGVISCIEEYRSERTVRMKGGRIMLRLYIFRAISCIGTM